MDQNNRTNPGSENLRTNAGEQTHPVSGNTGRDIDQGGTGVDPENARVQEQIHRDAEAAREQARRLERSTPAEVKDHTVGEIVEEAERRANQDRQG